MCYYLVREIKKTCKPGLEIEIVIAIPNSPDRSGNPFVPGFGTKDCNE